MILPTKHISAEHTIIGAGGAILKCIDGPQTITALWTRVKGAPEIVVYWRFILGLDFLYAIGIVDYENGLVMRRKV